LAIEENGYMALKPTCKEVHRLVSEGLDRDLSVVERLRMRLHLVVCDACTTIPTGSLRTNERLRALRRRFYLRNAGWNGQCSMLVRRVTPFEHRTNACTRRRWQSHLPVPSLPATLDS